MFGLESDVLMFVAAMAGILVTMVLALVRAGSIIRPYKTLIGPYRALIRPYKAL